MPATQQDCHSRLFEIKDGKHAQAQVVLGLWVSRDAYPLSYSLFNGSQYEGRTMIPIVEDFATRFELEDFAVVADSGLMNKRNIALLESAGYKYIIGARIKNESDEIWEWVFSLEKRDGLKGYMSNSNLSSNDIYEQYSGLWQVERAFRISKGTFNLRPMLLFTPKRIEAHVCICFVAYKVYKEILTKTILTKKHLSIDALYNEIFWKIS